jgi:hypothetical protein
VYALKYEGDVFKSMLENFQDMRIEVELLAKERESLRLARIRQKDMLL